MFAFSDQGKNTESPQAKQDWIAEVGTYEYYSLILSNFNPVVARQILDNPADHIARAWVSLQCYNYVPKEDR